MNRKRDRSMESCSKVGFKDNDDRGVGRVDMLCELDKGVED